MPGATLQREKPTTASGIPSVPTEFAEVHRRSTVWTVQLSLTNELLDDAGLKWDEWQEQDALSVVKTGQHRTVYKLEVPCGQFYIKRFRVVDWKAKLKNLFRPCQAEREWTAARRMTAMHLPTFQTIALGKTIHSGIVGESFLITRGIAGAVSLDDFILTRFPQLLPRQQVNVRQQLAVELGRLTGKLHQWGFDHGDFHAGNVLVQLEADGSLRLWLIDLQAVLQLSVLSQRARDRSLGTLNQFFVHRATRTDRLRFFREYRQVVEGEDSTRGNEIQRQRGLNLSLRVMADRGWKRADRAWRRGNRHVKKLDVGTTHCRGLATLETSWLTAIRDNPESLFTDRLLHWCKRSGRHRVAAVTIPYQTDEVLAFWKSIEERNTLQRWGNAFRESTVRHAWEIGHAFLRRGIATPRPLMFVETKSKEADRQYLMTEAIPDSVTLDDYLADLLPKLSVVDRNSALRAVSYHLADQLRRLHAARFDHRDLKFQNILVSTNDASTWILDLDAVRTWSRLPTSRAVQNLARVNVSSLQWPEIRHSERVRFLKGYLGERFTAEWKWWWRQIARRSVQKQKQNQRRGRPLS